MTPTPKEQMAELVQHAQRNIGLVKQLPAEERGIVQDAIDGSDVYQIAQNHGVTEARVWQVLNDAARSGSDPPVRQAESAGLGSDTDPGVTGGYGDTGFGSLGTEPPEPVPEEPSDEDTEPERSDP